MNPVENFQIQTLRQKVSAEARLLVRDSLSNFAMLYFDKHLKSPDSRMHKELYELLEVMQPRIPRLAIAAPRGNAKSTLVSLIFVLWSICHRRHHFIVLIADTKEKASEFLDNIKHELVENDKLAGDFPEVCEPGRQSPHPPRWRSHEIITHNLVKVLALGEGQSIRGRRYIDRRPDLMILDDVENRDNTNTPEARAKISDWFYKSIVKAGTSDTQVLVVGTIQHYDSLLARLTDSAKSPTWEGRIYRSVISWSDHSELWDRWSAILHSREEFKGETGPEAARRFFESRESKMLEGTEVLWPEVEPYYALMLMRESDGAASFDSEKQNQPVNPKDCFFLETDFVFWDDRFESEQQLIDSMEGKYRIYGACDPSLGRLGKHADDSAIITLLQDNKRGTLYVLDAIIARPKPHALIEDILAYARMRDYSFFAFETNQFQEFLADELRRRSDEEKRYLRVKDICHTTDKVGRIQSLQPLVKAGRLQFSRRHRALLDQLRFFPKAAHDDGPDALQMAVVVSRESRRAFGPKDIRVGPPRLDFSQVD